LHWDLMMWGPRTRFCLVASFGLAATVAAVTPSDGTLGGCFHEGQDYVDKPATDRPPNGGLQAGPRQCQARCQRESWCDHFFWRKEGVQSAGLLQRAWPKGCWLLNGAGYTSTASSSAGYLVHGPKVCPVAAAASKSNGGIGATQSSASTAAESLQEDTTESGSLAGLMLEPVEKVGKFMRSDILKWWMAVLISILAFCMVLVFCACCTRCCTGPRQRVIEEELEFFGDATEDSLLVDEASTREETLQEPLKPLKAVPASASTKQVLGGVKGLEPRRLFARDPPPWAAAINLQDCMVGSLSDDSSSVLVQQPLEGRQISRGTVSDASSLGRGHYLHNRLSQQHQENFGSFAQPHGVQELPTPFFPGPPDVMGQSPTPRLPGNPPLTREHTRGQSGSTLPANDQTPIRPTVMPLEMRASGRRSGQVTPLPPDRVRTASWAPSAEHPRSLAKALGPRQW